MHTIITHNIGLSALIDDIMTVCTEFYNKYIWFFQKKS